jgi:hypothetical protein
MPVPRVIGGAFGSACMTPPIDADCVIVNWAAGRAV